MKTKTFLFLFSFSFDVLNFLLLIFLVQSEERRDFQNNISFSVPYHIQPWFDAHTVFEFFFWLQIVGNVMDNQKCGEKKSPADSRLLNLSRRRGFVHRHFLDTSATLKTIIWS